LTQAASRKTLAPHWPPAWAKLLLGAAVILLAAVAVYWPALHAGFIWDDDDILTANPLVTAPDGLRLIWSGGKFYDYWPLTLTSFWLEWRLWGLAPTGYHLTNILLHAAIAILFWRVLTHLQIPAAWLAALIFAIHPINVQSVAWITERKNTLSLFFFGLALLGYLRFDRDSRRFWYWASLAAFVLALLSKTSVVMLPFVLLACAWWRRGGLCRRDWLNTLPFFAVALVLALVTIWFQYRRSIGSDVVGPSSFAARLVGAGMAAWFYLARILFPRHPMFVYPRWSLSSGDLAAYLPGALILGVWFLFWWYRQGWARPFFFAWSCFLVMLFPVLGFFNIYFQKYSFVSDHWLYPAMISIIALAVGGPAALAQAAARRAAQSAAQPPPRKHHAKTTTANRQGNAVINSLRGRLSTAIGVIATVAVVGVLAPLTWAQCRIYRDEETLWRATLKLNPACWLAHHNLASLLVGQAKEELSAGSAPAGYPALNPSLVGKLNEALSHELQTVARKPDHATAEYGAGHILCLLNRTEEAVPHFRRAIQLQPDLLPAIDSLAWILATHENAGLRKAADAVRLAQTAVALTASNDPHALQTLAVANAAAGDFPAAAAAAQRALKLAETAGDEMLARELTMQLRLFQTGRRSHVP
jgi:protein O-mannosyl-transferase